VGLLVSDLSSAFRRRRPARTPIPFEAYSIDCAVEEELTQMSLHNLFTEEYSIREGRPIQTFDRAWLWTSLGRPTSSLPREARPHDSRRTPRTL